jgi:hypothetical protein
MFVQKSHYEACLAEYSNTVSAIALLKQHRPYLEMIPSLRRPDESVIAIPLPVAHLRNEATATEAIRLPCDVAILMCDPEWKIKTEPEILIFIHRPHEDFSDILGRWRQTQVDLNKNYEWLMPSAYKHILSEGTNTIYPLFVLFPETSKRIKRGFVGAHLPFVTISAPELLFEESTMENLSSDGLSAEA